MLEVGLVVESTPLGRRVLTGERSDALGVPLSLDPSAAGAVGIDFAHESVRVVVADVAHAVLAEEERYLGLDHDASEALDLGAVMVTDALEVAGLDRSRVLGVGVGVPGPVDQARGCPTPSSISASWVGLEVGAEMGRRLGLPVALDNNVNLAALAEAVWGAAKGFRDAVYVKISTGVGAGVVLDRRIWRGAAGMAGEIGHMTVDESGPMCRCGNRGCLEAYVGLPAQLQLLSPVLGSGLDEDKLVDLVLSGDARCRRVLVDVSHTLGKALASVCNVINPAAIVLGGEFASLFEVVNAPISEAISRYALHLAASSVEVVPGALGERAGALGGAALVFHRSDLVEELIDLEGASLRAWPATGRTKP
jgi:predicted NBD/HSP70 family sugar kinase